MTNTMKDSPEVDVIILSWNRVDDTIAAIASAADQEGVDKRILVVDQGSDPKNLSRLERFLQTVSCAQLKKLSQNAGVADGRNIASAMGQAAYIVALDSDAVFADRFMLARAVAHLEANPHLCAVGFRILNYVTGRNDDTSWDYPSGCSPDQRFATTRFIGAGHALRRSTFEAVGGYDQRLFFCGEEVDLCYRMLDTGQRIEYLPAVTILHKVSPEHRVFWGEGRFFYTVRNTLYTLYKFGTPWPRRLLAAGSFLTRGLRNGIPMEALRGMIASGRMCRAFRLSHADKSTYQLADSTWQYILRCEPSRRQNVAVKIRRQLARLPHQGQT